MATTILRTLTGSRKVELSACATLGLYVEYWLHIMIVGISVYLVLPRLITSQSTNLKLISQIVKHAKVDLGAREAFGR